MYHLPSGGTHKRQGRLGGTKKSAPAVNSALLLNFLSENRQTRLGRPPTPRTPIYGRAIRAPLLVADLESSGEGRGHFVLVIDFVIVVIR